MSENPSTSLSSGSTTRGKVGISIFKKQFSIKSNNYSKKYNLDSTKKTVPKI